MSTRLRIAHLVIQPVLVYDDGKELTPGPDIQAVQLTLAQAIDMLTGLPAEVEALATQIAAQASVEGEAQAPPDSPQ